MIDQLIQLTALRWIDEFFTICPDDLLPFTPKLLETVLPSLAHSATSLDQAAHKVNESLSNLILSVPQIPLFGTPSTDKTQRDNSSYWIHFWCQCCEYRR